MKFEELLARLETNAGEVKPTEVDIPGIGAIFVRKRTVLEYEQMHNLTVARKDGELKEADAVGRFGPSLARLLCDETGKRFTHAEEDQLAIVLAKQPDDIFHLILNAADGNKPVKAEDEGK